MLLVFWNVEARTSLNISFLSNIPIPQYDDWMMGGSPVAGGGTRRLEGACRVHTCHRGCTGGGLLETRTRPLTTPPHQQAPADQGAARTRHVDSFDKGISGMYYFYKEESLWEYICGSMRGCVQVPCPVRLSRRCLLLLSFNRFGNVGTFRYHIDLVLVHVHPVVFYPGHTLALSENWPTSDEG